MKEIQDIWGNLLSSRRLGRVEAPAPPDPTRSEFDRDYDRIVFSSAFRRLKDKTQVFPLSRNDFTRTRLTHSIEVACVGRTLGRRVAHIIPTAASQLGKMDDVASVVSAACLAHDIGNPPFGHSGEAAIQRWSRQYIERDQSFSESAQERQDLCEFEGNAQGLRVVARLQANRRKGGLQLTLATIGAMMKYPCGSLVNGKERNKDRIEQKKFGYFRDDEQLITDGLRELGLRQYAPGAFSRHPLAFLVEAADDICYAVVDLEDSVDQRLLSVREACEVLEPIASKVVEVTDRTFESKAELHWLRANAIQALIDECVAVFEANQSSIFEGSFATPLIDGADLSLQYEAVLDKVRSTAYKNDRVLAVELAGFEVIGGLLEIFVPALLSPKSKHSSKLIELFPASFLGDQQRGATKHELLAELSDYQRILAATDYVAGMTDTFAVNIYQQLSGIKLPE